MSVQYTYNDNRYETGLPQPYMNMRVGDVLHVGVAKIIYDGIPE